MRESAPSRLKTGTNRPRFRAALGLGVFGLLFALVAPTAVLANDAGLTIVKTADSANAQAGATIGFRITVQIHVVPGHDPLCVPVGQVDMQCPANNVVVRDQLPTAPLGLIWTIDAATSDPGCDIGVTEPGWLTCKWGNLTQPNEQRTVHFTSPTTTPLGNLCGTVTNPVAMVLFTFADGAVISGSDQNDSVVVQCATPPPTPTPTASVAIAPNPPRVTLPPPDALAGVADGSAPGGGYATIMFLLVVALNASILVLIVGRRARD